MKNMELTLEHKDARGALYRVLLPTNQELLLFFSKAGSLRGGHSHNVPELVVLLTGRLRYHKKRGDKEKVFELSAGQVVRHSPGEIHMAEFLEDSWLVEWKINSSVGEWVTTDYEPYRERVRRSLL